MIISVLGKQRQTDSEQYGLKNTKNREYPVYSVLSPAQTPQVTAWTIYMSLSFLVCACAFTSIRVSTRAVCTRRPENSIWVSTLSLYLAKSDLSYFCFCEAYSKLAGLQACGLCSCLCLLTAEIKGVCHHTYWTLVLSGIFLFINNPCNYQLSQGFFPATRMSWAILSQYPA